MRDSEHLYFGVIKNILKTFFFFNFFNVVEEITHYCWSFSLNEF